MLSLDELKLTLNDFLGTTERNLYTPTRRTNMINRAIRYLIKRYDIPAYTIKTNLVVVNGVCSVPTDFMRTAKLYKQPMVEYIQKDFDQFGYNIPLTYSIQYDAILGQQRLNVYPVETTTMYLWYIQIPDLLVDGADEVRFPIYWEEAIAAKAAELLFRTTRSSTASADMKNLADELIGDAWQTERSFLQGKEDQRLQSVYEKRGLLNDWSVYNDNYTTQPMFSGSMAMVTVTSDATIQANYAYNVDGGALVILTLPTQAQEGDTFAVVRTGAFNWRIAQNAGQTIIFGDIATTPGVTGYLESTAVGDAIQVVCTTQNSEWAVCPGSIGNITYV